MGDHPPFETVNLNKVLGQGPGLRVKPIRLGNPSQERDRGGIRKVPVDRLEDILLSILDVLLGTRVLAEVHKVLDGRRANLFVLGCDEQGGDTHQLQLGDDDGPSGEEAVNQVDSDKEGLREHAARLVHCYDPVG